MPAHLFLAHFPVALILVGAAADAAGATLRDERLRRFAGALLLLGAGFALLSFFTGQNALSLALMRVGPADERVGLHTQWGGAGVWGLAAAAVLRGFWMKRLDGWRGWAALAAALASAALVVAITLTGSAIAHG